VALSADAAEATDPGEDSKRSRPLTQSLSVGAVSDSRQLTVGALDPVGAVSDSRQLTVGALDPVGDFQRLVAACTGTGTGAAGSAVRAMLAQVHALSGEEVLLSKAVACIRALRTGSIQLAEPTGFNSMLRSLRAASRGQASEGFQSGSYAVKLLWASVEKDAALGLITKIECEASTVTVQDAAAFRGGASKPLAAEPVAAAADAGAAAATLGGEEDDDDDDDDDDLL
jgi:hypothetical protein